MTDTQVFVDLGDLFTRFRSSIQDLLPNLFGALAIFLFGLLIAYLLRLFIRRLVISFDRIIPNKRIQGTLKRIGMQRPAAELLSRLVFWIVLLFFVTAATETLGLPVVTTWISGIALYLPKLFSAALIVFAGLVVGTLLRDVVGTTALSAGLEYGLVLGKLVQGLIVLLSFVVATEQVGFNIDLLTNLMMTLVGAVALGCALAFALGARGVVGNILAAYYVQQMYQVGQRVRIDAYEGAVVRITPTNVLLDTEQGRVTVPAKDFGEKASILIPQEES